MFDHGKLNIYMKSVIKSAGGAPIEVLTFYRRVWYGEINFSVNEYYAAKQAETQVSRRIRIHQDRNIRGGRYAVIIDDVQYDVGRYFHGEDKGVLITDITLEEAVKKYEIVE